MAKAAVDGRDRNTSTRTSKKPRASAPASFINEDDDSSDEIQDDGGDDGEEEGGGATDMRGIIKELQKRKMAKAGTRTNSIQNQKAALYAEARQNAYDAVKDGNDYLDQALDTMHQINCQEGSYKNRLKDILPLYNANDTSVRSLLETYPALLQDLVPRKTAEIDAASTMLMSLPMEREKSRKKLMRNARAQIDEGLEKQRLATDAAALIKHYKALLLA